MVSDAFFISNDAILRRIAKVNGNMGGNTCKNVPNWILLPIKDVFLIPSIYWGDQGDEFI